jgi:hypothetical protein
MPRKRTAPNLDADYLVKLRQTAVDLGLTEGEIEACIGGIVGELAEAFLLIQKPDRSWLPMMFAKRGPGTSCTSITETVACWLDTGAEKILLATSTTLKSEILAVRTYEFAGVRFSIVDQNQKSLEPTCAATDAALAACDAQDGRAALS